MTVGNQRVILESNWNLVMEIARCLYKNRVWSIPWSPRLLERFPMAATDEQKREVAAIFALLRK